MMGEITRDPQDLRSERERLRTLEQITLTELASLRDRIREINSGLAAHYAEQQSEETPAKLLPDTRLVIAGEKMVQLCPNRFALIEVLWDRQPHTFGELTDEVYGRESQGKEIAVQRLGEELSKQLQRGDIPAIIRRRGHTLQLEWESP